MKTSLIHSLCLAFFLLPGHLTHGQTIQKLTHELTIQELTHKQIIQKAFLFQEMVAPKVDTYPSFPGGDEALGNYIYTHMKEASEAVGQSTLSSYSALVAFQLDEKGNVIKDRIWIKKGTPDLPLLNEKVEEMIKTMPQWSPCIIGNTASPQIVGLTITYDPKMSQFDHK